MTYGRRLGVTGFLPIKVLFMVILFMVQSLNAAGKDASWSFAFVADSRSSGQAINNGVNTRVLNLIALEIAQDIRDQNIGCELVLFGGDLIRGQYSEHTSKSNSAAYQQWKEVMKPVYDAFHEKKAPLVPIYPVRGNHEIYHKKTGSTEESVKNEWMNAFGNYLPQNGPPPPPIESDEISPQKGLNYFVKHKDVLFVAIDQYVTSGYDPSVNQSWLDLVLQQEKTGPHVFVFGHTPAWQTLEGKKSKSLFNYPEIRDKFWDSICRSGCRVYLTGHQHYTSVNIIKHKDSPDMWQIMSGSAGAPLTESRHRVIDPDRTIYLNQTDYGYYIGKVNGDEVTLKFKYYSESENKWISDDRSIVKYKVR